MASQVPFLPIDSGLRAFLDANPTCSLTESDFYDPEFVKGLAFGNGDPDILLEAARVHQGLARLSDDPAIVDRLFRRGVHSASAIVGLSEDELAALLTPTGALSEKAAGAGEDGTSTAPPSPAEVAALRKRAVDRSSRAVHMFAQMIGALALHGRSASANHLATALTEAFGHLPTFTELFGSQDFLPTPYFQSVMGPAAYLLDLMRVVDSEVTNNPRNKLVDIAKLPVRRPDLFALPLTCVNTALPIPKIQAANRAIQTLLAPKVGADTDYALATRVFPFLLPVHLPLTRTRAALKELGASLVDVYEAFAARAKSETLPDAAAISTERLCLSAEQRRLVAEPRSGDALAACFGGGDALLAPPRKTTVAIAKDSLTVTGSSFKAMAAAPGTVLGVGDSLRAVIEVVSDTELKVDQAWPQAKANVDGWFYAPDTLSQVSMLANRIGVVDADIMAYFRQNLSDEEAANGLSAKLYVNAGSKLPPAFVLTDRLDVSYTLQVVVNLDEARIDRLDRLVRLSRVSGMAVADLEWALHATNPAAELNDAALTVIGEVAALSGRLRLPMDETCALFSVLKTWGRGTGSTPADLFDRVFNAVAMTDGSACYRPTYADNPLFLDTVKIWTLAAAGKTELELRAWLAAAIGVSDQDLLKIAGWIAAGGATLDLDVPTLSALWSVARLARALGATVADILTLMNLLGIVRFVKPADVRAVIDLKSYLGERRLRTADLAYIISGEAGTLGSVVRRADIGPFLTELRAYAAEWMVTARSFVPDLGEKAAAKHFEMLVWSQVIDASGVVLFKNWQFVFDVITGLFTISARELCVSGIVSRDEAIEAHDALQTGVLNGNNLSIPVDRATDLSFLFPRVADSQIRKAKIEAIRGVLMDFTFRISVTISVNANALRMQEEGTYSRLAQFLQIGADVSKTVADFVLTKALPNLTPRQLLLTAQGDVETLKPPLTLVGRITCLARLLGLANDDAIDAIASPAAFGLTSLDTLDLAAVRSWSDYATLVAQFEPPPTGRRSIATYLKKGDAAELCRVTGWNTAAFAKLVGDLWGAGTVLTPGQLIEARRCFALAASLGTDIRACLSLAELSRLSPMPENRTPPPDEWTRHKTAANDLVNLLKAKTAGGDWTAAFKPVRDREETVRRDGGVALAVWLMRDPPYSFDTVRALSEYLLIDLETGTADTTSPIVEATTSVQMYLQRCRMSLEPGVVSLGLIAEAWWPWLLNYRVWEANRKIFLYPENYVDPNLRPERTDLFRKMQEELQQSDITPASVERAFTNYLTAFADLAKLRTVDSVKTKAPHPVSGTPVDTVFFLGRTENKPYTYYYRTMRDGNVWSQWVKIDVALSSPDATMTFAFNRLFLFWVEIETIQGSHIREGTQSEKSTQRAQIRYAYHRLDKTWTAPQTLEADLLFNAQPAAYYTGIIDPRAGQPSIKSIDSRMAYWNRVFVQPVPGPENDGDRLLILYGNAFDVPATPDVPAPDPKSFTTNDERSFVSNVYVVSQIGKALGEKCQGNVLLMPVAYLDIGMNADWKPAFLPNFAGGTDPFSFSKWQANFGTITSRSILVDGAFSDASDYPQRVVNAPNRMITNVAAGSRLLAVKNQAGWFVLDNGDEAFLLTPKGLSLKAVSDILTVSAQTVTVHGLDGNDVNVACELLTCGPYFDRPIDLLRQPFVFTRLTTGAVRRLIQTMAFGGIDHVLSIDTQQAGGPAALDFTRFYPAPPKTPGNVVPPETLNGGAVDFGGAYRPYFEEIFFHAPFFIASQLNAGRHYLEAMRWYEHIFDPAAVSKGQTPPPGPATAVYWQYLPFRKLTGKSLIDMLVDSTAIEAWNASPFDPHTVAQLRPVAYEKTIVMRYVSNLLDWADSEFTKATRESVNSATLLYLTAADLLGPRPRQRGVYQPPAPMTFDDVKKVSGGPIPQFLVALERVLPTPQPGALPLEPAPFNIISAYFTVPENQDFIRYWDTLETRLFQIRNGLSITGEPLSLPLFGPPLDPNQLVGGGAAVLSQGNLAIPCYRFLTMLERAKQLAGLVAGYGAALLSALEKQDAEQLQILRLRQERLIQVQTGEMKAQLVDEATAQLAALQQTKLAAAGRRDHYAKLINDGLSAAEIVSMTTMILANVAQTAGGIIRTAAGAAYLIPNAGSPFAMTYGGREVGSSLVTFASALDVAAGTLSFASTLSGVIAGYQRRAQEWELQKQTATFEVEQITQQIAASERRVEALKKDLAITQLVVQQNDETMKALTGKFTNAELYSWLSARLSAIHFQVYKVALDLAMAAQRAFQFELDADTRFLDFSTWDSGRKGLLAGEGLQLALAQMERSYCAGNARRLTIDKTISLWSLNPQALLTLRRTGSCSFEFSELLFDYDFPGHYCRKIERLSVTIPAVVGPYQNVHGTLSQTGNTILIRADAETAKFLLGKDGKPNADALRLNWRAGQRIALSRGLDDGIVSGGEERYLPFEGTGAISTWRLDLPLGANRIDFSTISDVVVTLTYSALDAGDPLRQTVKDALANVYAGQVLLPLEQRFPDAWGLFLNPPAGQPPTLTMPIGPGILPANLTTPQAVRAFVQLDVNTSFSGAIDVQLKPAAGDTLSLSLTQAKPWADSAVSCPLAPEAVWTLILKSIPAELLDKGRLRPGVLKGATLILDYTATIAASA